jgi:hypothetical protein
MASRFYPKIAPLAVRAQIARMHILYPGLQRVSWKLGVVVWEGSLMPTDVSAMYRVSISYRLRDAPKVFVATPQLRRNWNGQKIPHRYADGSLCLYYPEYGEWTSSMFIAETIVPWTALWLYHYEVWHSTGEWLGGGIEHSNLRGSDATEAVAQ